MTVAIRMLALLALVACETSTASIRATLPRPVIHDSAGVRIIEYPSLGPEAPPSSPRSRSPLESTLRGLPEAFSIESKPYLDIGGAKDNEDEELDSQHPLLMAAELSNGTVVVSDRVQLKFFTSGGDFIRAVGRAGSGPGEFAQIREVCRLRGDSLLAIDYSSGRLSLWDANGKHVQTFPRPGVVQPGSCQPDGSVIVSRMRMAPSSGDSSDRIVPYRLLRPDGSIVRELVSLPATAMVARASPEATVRIVGEQLLVAPGREWEVRMQDLSGQVHRITRFGRPPVPITDQEWHDLTLRTFPPGSSRENIRIRVIERMLTRKPDAYPAYSRALVDPAGRVWVQDYESRGSFTVLDTSGVLLGRFVLPGTGPTSRKQLVSVEAGHVVVLDEDGDGAMHLRFYKITPIANTTR